MRERGIIERDDGKIWCRWSIRYPTGGRIDTECSPYFTRWGARFSEWFWRTI